MAKTFILEEMDFIDFQPFRDAEATFYIRNGKRFFYVGDTKIVIASETEAEWKEPEGNLVFAFDEVFTAVKWEGKGIKSEGKIVQLMQEERYFCIAFVPYDKKNHAVTILKVGDLSPEIPHAR